MGILSYGNIDQPAAVWLHSEILTKFVNIFEQPDIYNTDISGQARDGKTTPNVVCRFPSELSILQRGKKLTELEKLEQTAASLEAKIQALTQQLSDVTWDSICADKLVRRAKEQEAEAA